MIRTDIYLLIFILYLSSTLHINGQETFSFTANKPAGATSYTCTDSTSCQFSCIGDNACSQATMNCANGADCVFVCTGYSACNSAKAHCNGASTCTVHCNQTDTAHWSCYRINIRATSSNALIVRAIGTGVAKSSTIRCPDGSRCDLSFIGYQSGISSSIYCGSGGECFIEADGDESLYGASGSIVDAEDSNMFMVTAMGIRALGLVLKCPRSQPTEPRCIIQMIADENTDYTDGEIFYWNFITIQQETDIEFRCEGTPYDAFFEISAFQNYVNQYSDPNTNCFVDFTYQQSDFYNTNSWSTTCSAFSSDHQCTMIPTVAPTLATDMPTTMPTVTPTTEIPTPLTTPPTEFTASPTKSTTSPTAYTASPTKTPTTSPTEMPAITPTPAPTEMPVVRPTPAPTEMPTTPPTKAPSQSTANPTKRPTEHSISAMKPTGAPSPSVDVTLAEGEVVEGTDGSEDDLNDVRTSNKTQTSDALVAVALSFGFIAIGSAACIWYKSLQMKKQHEEAVKYIDGTSSIENTTIGGGEYKDTAEVPGSPRLHQTNDNVVPIVFKGNQTEEKEEEEDKDSDDIKDWLEQMGLPMYYDCFVQNGLTSLQFIGCINDKNDLHNIGIMLVGHQMVLMGEIMKLKQSNTETLVAEEGNGTFITEGGEDEENTDDEGAGGITAGNICKPEEFEQNLSDAAFISDIVMDDVINDIEAGENAETGVTAGGGMTAGMEYNAADGSDQDVDDILM